MIRNCVHEDEFIGDGDSRCGKSFDDAKYSTICPHEALPGPMSEEDIDEMIDRVKERND